VLSFDNTCIVTGGDDCIARIYKLSKDLRRIDGKAVELKGPTMPITGVDICREN
jgi:hypothetical protein